MAENNVFNSFSFDEWAEYVRREKIEEEIIKQRMDQISAVKLRVKLVRERELRAQSELLSDEDIDKLIGYINAGHTLKGGLAWGGAGTVAGRLSDKVAGYLPRDDDYIFNEIKGFYRATNSLKGLHGTISNTFLHNHRRGEGGRPRSPDTRAEFVRFHFNRRFSDKQ